MLRRLAVAATALTFAALAGCSETKEAPKAPATPPAPAPKAPAAGAPAGTGAAVAAASGKSDPECVGPIDTGVPETVKIGERTLELSGYLARVTSAADADDEVKIGVIANANEASPENLFNFERYKQFFQESGVELIVVAGDSGDDRASIQTVLRSFADTGLPVLAIAGNRESKADFVDAVNAVRKEKPNLLNGNRVRHLDWDDVDLFTLPGYHDPRYIHAESKGCQYFQQDVDALGKIAKNANDPAVLVSHGGPNGQAPTALDVIEDKSNVGDPAINGLLNAGGIAYGVFPNIKEAGGRAVADIGGAKLVAEGSVSPALYLNPGSADSVAWTMNDGTTAQGLAAVLSFKAKQASYKLFKAPPLTDADKAAAAKLVPPAPAGDAAAVKNE